MTQIVVFGHSIVHGYWDTEGGWVQRLRSFLDSRALEQQDEELIYYVYEMGVSGDDTGMLLERFKDEMEARYEPDEENIILFQIGENDHMHRTETGEVIVEKEEFRENLEKLLEEARDFTSKILFVGAFPSYPDFEAIPHSPSWSVNNEGKRRYEEIKRELCEKQDIPYLDLSHISEDRDVEELVEDGIHPNNEGHEMIKEEVKRKMREKGFIE